jgi:hypothetical protein
VHHPIDLSSLKESEGRFTDQYESQRGATEHDKRNIERLRYEA